MADTPDDLAAALQDMVAALAAAAQDPADALRLLADLATFREPPGAVASAVGQAVADMQGALGDLLRRTAVIALARASAAYQPASYDDANRVRTLIVDLLDVEILAAADQGEDAVYAALRTLRAAVAIDLGRRSAGLARVVVIETPQPLPALALANRLYGGAARDAELVASADPVHPLFMPMTFKALSE